MLNQVNIKKQLLNKSKGQALLTILVVSTLTLVVLLGIASRLNSNRTNIRRSAEFDRALAASENALNEIIRTVGTDTGCQPSSDVYTAMNDCAALNAYVNSTYANTGERAEVFGKVAGEGVGVSSAQPLTLALNSERISGVFVKCFTGANLGSSSIDTSNKKMIITLVYVDSSGDYKLLKGITTCSGVQNDSPGGSCSPNGRSGNVVFYAEDGRQVNNGSSVNLPLNNAQLARARLLDSPQDTYIQMRVLKGETGCPPAAQTGSYEFIVTGLGGLGSDNVVKFEKPQGENAQIPSAFDFVFFGEEP